MNQPQTIIFDFDGTIADVFDMVLEIYNKIALKYNCKIIKSEDKEVLRGKRPQEFLKDYGITFFKLPRLLLRGKKELRAKISEIKPFDGMADALKEIKNAGFNLGIMTSNSKENVEIFLENNNLSWIFNFIYSGKNIFGKDKTIKKLLKEQNIPKNSAVYVGDETRDIEAMKKIGLRIISVSWGFNSKEILATLNPDAIADKPEDLLKCLREI